MTCGWAADIAGIVGVVIGFAAAFFALLPHVRFDDEAASKRPTTNRTMKDKEMEK